MKISQEQKRKVVNKALEILTSRYLPEYKEGNCVLCTISTIQAIQHELGCRSILQAGTCLWPRLTPEQDDGKPETVTHFGYVWEKHSPVTRIRLKDGLLPEMHVWVAIPENDEIVDITTRDFPIRCQEVLGKNWPGMAPPEYLWDSCNEIPDGVRYHPDMDAICVAMNYIEEHQGVLRLTWSVS